MSKLRGAPQTHTENITHIQPQHNWTCEEQIWDVCGRLQHATGVFGSVTMCIYGQMNHNVRKNEKELHLWHVKVLKRAFYIYSIMKCIEYNERLCIKQYIAGISTTSYTLSIASRDLFLRCCEKTKLETPIWNKL